MKSALWLTQVFPRRANDPYGSFLLRLAREMPARGWDVTVVAPGDEGVPGDEVLSGVRVVRFDLHPARATGLAYRGEMHRAAARRPFAFVRFLRAFRDAANRQAESRPPDVIHAHWWIPTGWIARGVAARARRPWVCSLHGTDVRLTERWPILRPVAARVVESASAVLPVSETLARDVAGWGVPADRREVLPMPADAELFDIAPNARRDDGSPVRFVLVARLTGQKRVADAIAAVARLRDASVDVVLDIVGDGPERGRLERLTHGKDLGDRIVFHGLQPTEAVESFYRRSRALLLPSEHEGYGITVIEAALGGVPAIVARSGALPELVESGRTGIVVDVGDPDALARAMRMLAEDSDLAHRLGDAARVQARRRTAGPLSEQLAAVYNRIPRP